MDDLAYFGIVGIQIVFLSAEYIGLHFFENPAQVIELAAALVKAHAIDIHRIYSCDIRWFLLQWISPCNVFTHVFDGQGDGSSTIRNGDFLGGSKDCCPSLLGMLELLLWVGCFQRILSLLKSLLCGDRWKF
jgi:hypothetical protein